MNIDQYAKSTAILAGIVLVFAANGPLCAADDPTEACREAAQLYADGDVEGALEEARWCVTQLEQIKKNQISSFFRDAVGGFEGGELSSQQAMGITVIEREYARGDKYINVSLTGGSAGSANNAFAALASLGMQAGTGEKIRIQKRNAMLTDDGGPELVVTLKNGGMLTFTSDDVAGADLVAFAKEFPVAELDDSME